MLIGDNRWYETNVNYHFFVGESLKFGVLVGKKEWNNDAVSF